MKHLLKISLALFAVIIILAAGTFFFIRSEYYIEMKIKEANYCQTKNDCIELQGQCPFGCYVYVNKSEGERIKNLIDSYESTCIYGCIESSGYDCLENKCVSLLDQNNSGAGEIDSFEKCAKAGNPIMESYPRQCKANGKTFVEDIGNELEKADLIRINYPRPNQKIESPLVVTGEARGYWFFEADFPVILTDWDGEILAIGIAMADGDWMTEDFVPFKATIEFDKPELYDRGSLILQKDNPSGLPEYDDALEIPINFK